MTGVEQKRKNHRETRRQQQIEHIVDTSARLFAANGFANTGMAELCESLDMGRGQLYNLVDSKESILVLIYERFANRLMEGAARVQSLGLPPAERLRAMVRDLIELIAAHSDDVLVFLTEGRSLSEQNREVYRKLRRRYQDLYEQALTEGVETGVFHVANVRLAVLGLLGMANSSYLWIQTLKNMSAGDVSDLLCEIFLYGVTSDRYARLVSGTTE